MMCVESLRIDRRFRGPPQSGNGGYVCGRLARHVEGPARVRLSAPPPLDVNLRVEISGDNVRLLHDWTLIAEARPETFTVDIPNTPSFGDAARAAQRYTGFENHPFPGCFGCGPHRSPGDGLCIFPGRLGDGPMLAGLWIPDPSLAADSNTVLPEFVWAALDCAGGFAVADGLPGGATLVLGELRAQLEDELSPGEPCVVMAWPLRIDGRKRYAGTAVVAPSGRIAAKACATWIEVPDRNFAAG